MVKPKKKRPSDVNMRAASILSDAIKLSERPVKFPGKKKPSKAG